jgi:hypothetical protein
MKGRVGIKAKYTSAQFPAGHAVCAKFVCVWRYSTLVRKHRDILETGERLLWVVSSMSRRTTGGQKRAPDIAIQRKKNSVSDTHKSSIEPSNMTEPRRAFDFGPYIETFWRNKLAVAVLISAIAAIFYVFDVLPEQQLQEFRTQPTVIESGRVIALGRESITVQLAQGPISTPTTLPLHVGDTVEVRHMKAFPARVVSIRRVAND